MLTGFPSARFLLPFAQLSETLASFLLARVTVETERKKGLENRSGRPAG